MKSKTQRDGTKRKAKGMPDGAGHFGPHGGRYVAETLMPAVLQLESAYRDIAPKPAFRKELGRLLADYAGRRPPFFTPGG